LRLDRLQEFEPLCRKAARWVKDHAEEIQVADPAMPSEMNSDRALDNWRPLFAIADAIGGEWPRRAREAAVAMSKADQEFDEEPATLLLQDLQMLFRVRGDDRLESREIVRSLVAMEDGPWADYRRGRPLTERGLAKILGLFRIKSQKWAVTEAGRRKWRRGYFLSDLEDTFARYVPAPTAGPAAEPTASTEPPQAPQAPHVPPLPEPTGPSSEPPQAPQPKPAKKGTNPILPPPSRPRS
jgi:hypothetical protein